MTDAGSHLQEGLNVKLTRLEQLLKQQAESSRIHDVRADKVTDRLKQSSINIDKLVFNLQHTPNSAQQTMSTSSSSRLSTSTANPTNSWDEDDLRQTEDALAAAVQRLSSCDLTNDQYILQASIYWAEVPTLFSERIRCGVCCARCEIACTSCCFSSQSYHIS